MSTTLPLATPSSRHLPAAGVSVIVVSWNAREYLRLCLASLRRARAACVVEIIVVDNASVDGSPDMVEHEFPETTLVRAGSNLGFARANNLAMRRARGALFALVNSDAEVHPRCLERLAEQFERHPDVGLAGPRVIGADGRLQRTCRNLPGVWNTLCRALALDRLLAGRGVFRGHEVPAHRHAEPHAPAVLSGCFCVARRTAVEEVGGLDERFFFYGEDIDWSKRFGDAGWALAFVPQATATHFGGASAANAPLRFSIEILRATLTYWRKHHGPGGGRLCLLLLLLHHGLRCAARAVSLALGIRRSATTRRKLALDAACLRWLVSGAGPDEAVSRPLVAD